jgi:hypothetical protein
MAPGCYIPSLYLDATYGVAVMIGPRREGSSVAQEFPVSAKRLPVTKVPGERQLWDTPKPIFFNHL